MEIHLIFNRWKSSERKESVGLGVYEWQYKKDMATQNLSTESYCQHFMFVLNETHKSRFPPPRDCVSLWNITNKTIDDPINNVCFFFSLMLSFWCTCQLVDATLWTLAYTFNLLRRLSDQVGRLPHPIQYHFSKSSGSIHLLARGKPVYSCCVCVPLNLTKSTSKQLNQY